MLLLLSPCTFGDKLHQLGLLAWLVDTCVGSVYEKASGSGGQLKLGSGQRRLCISLNFLFLVRKLRTITGSRRRKMVFLIDTCFGAHLRLSVGWGN